MQEFYTLKTFTNHKKKIEQKFAGVNKNNSIPATK